MYKELSVIVQKFSSQTYESRFRSVGVPDDRYLTIFKILTFDGRYLGKIPYKHEGETLSSSIQNVLIDQTGMERVLF